MIKKKNKKETRTTGLKQKKRGRGRPKKNQKLEKKKERTKKSILIPEEGAKTNEEKIQTIIAKGRMKGFVTYNEILKYFPTIEEDIGFLEELYGRLEEARIDVFESGGMIDIKKTKKKKKDLC